MIILSKGPLMKNTINLLILLLFPALLMGQPSFPVSSIDPSVDAPFSGRGADQLVIFTPNGERKTTLTNQYGSEAIIKDGIVIEVGENDQLIPSNGFVVSGHGKAATWINNSLSLGFAVTYDENTIFIDESPEGKYTSILYRMNQMGEKLENDTELLLKNFKKAHKAMKSEEEINTATVAVMEKKLENFETLQWELFLSQIPSPKKEVRAVWHRLSETTPEAIAKLVEDWERCGINVAFPETIYGSQAIFNDETGLYKKFPMYGEIDPLAILIEECHKRDIEVHAWVHCFFIGIEGNAEEPALLAKAHPEWVGMDRTGQYASREEPGFMYLNQCMPEVRQALINAYVALATNYDLDGFQFDYIRYSSATDWNEDWDYSEFTRKKVEAELGFDPMDITPDNNPDQWKQWRQWREDTVSTFVKEASEKVRAVDSNLILTADVFPELPKAIDIKGQNWAKWGREGYIDAILPMSYYTSSKAVAKSISELDKEQPGEEPLVVGLGPFLGFSKEQMINQILVSRQSGATGQVLFCWSTVPPEMQEALAKGPWKEKAEPDWTITSPCTD